MLALKLAQRQLVKCQQPAVISLDIGILHRKTETNCVRTFSNTSHPLRAGHSKWANIRHTKALKDGQKSAIFTRLSRQLRLAIQEGGSSNPALNSVLRSVMDEALSKNMPMASIQNSIKKFEQNKNQLKEYTLEIRYKQQNVYLICIAFTENFAAQKMSVASIVRKAGAAFADAAHLFEEFGLIQTFVSSELLAKIKSSNDLEDIATEDAINCGAEDIEVINHETGAVNFICDPNRLTTVRLAFESKGYKIENSDHIFQPKAYVQLNDEYREAYEGFTKKLLDCPGIEEVYDNVEPPS